MENGVSGLRAEGEALGVVGDNVANVSTLGFKKQRSLFEDVLLKSGTPGGGGAGVEQSRVQQVFTQGALSQTGVPTDLAITGEGPAALLPLSSSESNRVELEDGLSLETGDRLLLPAGTRARSGGHRPHRGSLPEGSPTTGCCSRTWPR